MDLKTIGHVSAAIVIAVYAGCIIAIIIIEAYRYFKKRNQPKEATHDHTDTEENISRGHHHCSTGNGLVSPPQGPAQTGAAVEVAEPNNHGEISGYGAEWACEKFGKPGHNYYFCPECNENFRLWIRQSASAQQRRAA